MELHILSSGLFGPKEGIYESWKSQVQTDYLLLYSHDGTLNCTLISSTIIQKHFFSPFNIKIKSNCGALKSPKKKTISQCLLH